MQPVLYFSTDCGICINIIIIIGNISDMSHDVECTDVHMIEFLFDANNKYAVVRCMCDCMHT